MHIIAHLGLNKSLLVLTHDLLGEKLTTVTSAFTTEDLVVLAQLNFVVVDSLTQIFSHRVAILDVVKLLKTVDRDGENLPRRLQHRS